MQASARQVATAEFGRYFLVSLVALGVDTGILLLAARFMHYLWAATAGFGVGAAVSYWLATRWAFVQRRLACRPRTEFAAYLLIGIFGVGVNNLVIFLVVDFFAAPLLLAKGTAAGATFVFNFLARKLALFGR